MSGGEFWGCQNLCGPRDGCASLEHICNFPDFFRDSHFSETQVSTSALPAQWSFLKLMRFLNLQMSHVSRSSLSNMASLFKFTKVQLKCRWMRSGALGWGLMRIIECGVKKHLFIFTFISSSPHLSYSCSYYWIFLLAHLYVWVDALRRVGKCGYAASPGVIHVQC